jgi:hypothetical protein
VVRRQFVGEKLNLAECQPLRGENLDGRDHTGAVARRVRRTLG